MTLIERQAARDPQCYPVRDAKDRWVTRRDEDGWVTRIRQEPASCSVEALALTIGRRAH